MALQSKLKNDLILRAARGEYIERTPVWLMRQAGRILPEYRAVRNKLSGFKELVTTPTLAAEVTVQPVDILKVDAAIIFSDILVVPEALGLDYEMVEKKGPVFPKIIKEEKDIDALNTESPEERLRYVTEAIRMTKRELADRVPLIGFAGAPFTIMAYMTEGSGSKTFSKARKMMYQRPDLAHKLLQKITDLTIAYLKAQVRAGADLIQVFDSWAGILPPAQYSEFSMPYLKQIADAINEVPLTLFAKGAYFAYEELAALDCQTIGVDWNSDPETVRRLVGANRTLQGNLDPCALYSSEKELEQYVSKMLKAFGSQRHIANLGHGVYPDTDFRRVQDFVSMVKAYKHEEASEDEPSLAVPGM